MKTCQACGASYEGVNAKYCSIECARPASKNKKHGLALAPEWLAWRDMRYRCQKPSRPDYPRYGGRGIKVCDRWQVFENFLEDMGRKPDPTYSIERIDNDGNYEPANCKWGSKAEQSRNRRCSLSPDKVQQIKNAPSAVPGTELAKQIGCSTSVVYRIRRGEAYNEDLT